ncbi:MAG: acetyl-CoA C-acyltransferase [Actinomycetota bacterium]|nr:acetyl-CoA C-acyltransferase [Actinomycetota bacterium]MDQ3645168.1 acetyl-CoA C-acyltransferase [Actinomycetota bacterium]
MPQAVIVDVVRTPIGRAFKGSLASLRPDNTGAFIVDALLERNPDVDPAKVEEVVTGCGLPQGRQAFNIGRLIALLSEKLPETVNGSTISRYCASGLDAIRIASNNVTAGQGDIYIAAGVEAVSQYNERQEAAGESDQNEKLQGSEAGQPNVYIGMGFTAVNVAKKYGVSREAMDEYAQRSQEQAVASQESGFFDREIVPVTLPDGTEVSKDDGPRASSSLEKLAELPEAFGGAGVTAGNSCPLNDGAAAALIMSEEKAAELGLEPRARIITAATWANEPEYMGVAPIGAIKKALDRAGMTIADIDTVELNEAFAAQVIPIMHECDIPLEKMNPHGGAIALGHPFGMTGVRIMTTLLNGLESDDKTMGLETMCVAGGQGEAMIVERLK